MKTTPVRTLALAAAFAVVGACGPGPSNDKCASVQCPTGTTCNPTTGICLTNSSGGGAGGGAAGGTGGGSAGGAGGGTAGGVGGGSAGGVGGGSAGGVGGGSAGGVGGGTAGGAGGSGGIGGGGTAGGVGGGGTAGGVGGGGTAGGVGGGGTAGGVGGGGTAGGVGGSGGFGGGGAAGGVGGSGGFGGGGTAGGIGGSGGFGGGGAAGGIGGGTGTAEDCFSAQTLSIPGTMLNFVVTTVGATDDADGTCNTSARGAEKVYRIPLSQAQDVTVSVARSAGAFTNPVVYLRGSPCNGGTQLACQDSPGAATTETVTVLNRTGDLYLFVESYGASNGSMDVSITLSPPTLPPTNDECNTAQALAFNASGLATANGNLLLASSSGMQGDQSPTCNFSGQQGKDVVYSYTLTSAQDVDITATGTGPMPMNPVIYVRKPGQCASPLSTNELGCADSFGVGPVKLSLINQQPGTYFLWVDSDFMGSGPFNLQVQLTPSPAAPANDSCGGAQVLTFNASNVATAMGNTGGATNGNAQTDPSPSCSPGARQSGLDVVYQFTTTALQDVVVNVARTGTSTLAPVVYLRPQTACASGTAPNELMCAASMGAFVTNKVIRLPAGTYSLWVDSNSQAERGAFDLTVTLQPPTMAPANDTCTTATALTPFDPVTNPVLTLNGTTQVASNNNSAGPNPSCSPGARTSGADVFYSYTLPTGTHQVSFAVAPLTSGYRPVAYLENACGAGAVQLACEQSNGGFGASAGTLAGFTVSQAGPGTFYVGVDSATATSGDFKMTGRIGAAPNDTCATAIPIQLSTPGVDNSIVDTTRIATADYSNTSAPPYAAACNQYTEAGKDVVFAFTYTGATARTVTATVTPDDQFDVGLLRLEGTCAPSSCVALDDSGAGGQEETLSWVAQPSTTYWLVVDGWVANEEGSFRLRVE